MKLPSVRGHRPFAGRLDKGQLNLLERAMVAAFHAPAGDFRDWNDVRDWAGEIAAILKAESAANPA
jgi:menaquinone-dependent protoporphyrinogen oxidase